MLLLLDIDGDHVLEDAGPEARAVVGHGAVLHGSREHHHVPGPAFHLDGVVVEVLDVVRVLGHHVRPGSDGGGSVLLAERILLSAVPELWSHSPEVRDEGDELDGEGRGGVHDVGVAGWVEGPVVGIVQVGELSALAGQDGVGGQAGDLGGLAQHHVTDVEDDRVLRHLLEYPALVEQCPDQSVVLVVLLVPRPVLRPVTPGPVHLVGLVVVVDDPPGGCYVLLGVHLLQLEPARALRVRR